jgi:hypothetical protein
VCIKIPGALLDEDGALLDEDYAVKLLEEYLEKDGDGRFRYSGAYFERLAGGGDRPEVAYQVTAEDLLAVSMLSVRVIRYYALDVLVYQAREISGLLAEIPVDVSLADPGPGGQDCAQSACCLPSCIQHMMSKTRSTER